MTSEPNRIVNLPGFIELRVPSGCRRSAARTADRAPSPFSINVSEQALVDLRRRLAATRWPDQETVTDESQGVQLATIQDLARSWQKDYDWRKIEARLNVLPQFTTEIDGFG